MDSLKRRQGKIINPFRYGWIQSRLSWPFPTPPPSYPMSGIISLCASVPKKFSGRSIYNSFDTCNLFDYNVV